MQKYLTVPETAELLRTTAKSVRNMIDRGQLPAYRPTGLRRVLIKTADAVRLVEGSTVSHSQPAIRQGDAVCQ